MCVARLKKVTTILVTLPNHVLPDAEFIADILERISDTEVLTENGISEEIIRETLRWIADNVTISMPRTVTPRIMDLAAAKMVAREPAEIREDHIKVRTTTEKPEQAGQSVMLFDISNMEAASTALILRKLLIPHLTHDTRKIPKLLQDGSLRTALSDDCGAVIVMCTKGIFENADILRFFIRISGLFLTFLPLICEQSFSVPRKDIVKTWQKNIPSATFTEEDLSTASFVVTSLFKEIAVHFDAKHSSLNILDVAASSVARRLLTDKNKVNASTSIPMGGSASIGRQLSKPSSKSAGKTYSSETSAQTPVDSGSFSMTSLGQGTGAESAEITGFDLQMSL